MRSPAAHNNFDEWPYGLYESRNSIVFFNRRYEPIVPHEYAEHPAFNDAQSGAGSLRLGSPPVTVVDRKTRIIFASQRWLYSDANPPRRDRKTGARLEGRVGLALYRRAARDEWIVGLDVGKSIDPSAICALNHRVIPGEHVRRNGVLRQTKVERFLVRYLERCRLGCRTRCRLSTSPAC